MSRDRAMELRAITGVEAVMADRSLDALLRHLCVDVIKSSTLPQPIRELYAAGTMLLREGQGARWERWLKAEVIGHCALHVGDQRELPRSFVAYQERQADEFAGWLIFGNPAETLGWPSYPLTTTHLARVASVPLECVERWWRIVGSELGYTEPYRRARMSWEWRTPAQRAAWGR